MRPGTGVLVLLATVLALSAWLDTGRASAGVRVQPRAVRSSRLLLGGRVRCTATAPSTVQVGHAVRVTFVLRNRSRRPVKVEVGVFDSGLVVRAADGTTYNSWEPLTLFPGLPPPLPKRIRPHSSLGPWRLTVRARWSGPLRITPSCEGKPLPALHVAVASPGPPPDETTALNAVIAASGGLLDQCRPQTPGVAVDGQIVAPDGSAPPMPAACSVSLEPEGTFWVAQELVLIPVSLPGVTVQQPYELFAPPYSPLSPLPSTPPPYEAIAWQFVLTREATLPVAAATVDATNGPPTQMEPSWYWDGTTWKSAGTGSCGSHGWSWGATSPTIDFISACPA